MCESPIFQAEVRYWSNRGYDVHVRLDPFGTWEHGFVPYEDLKVLSAAENNDGQNGFYIRIYDEAWQKLTSDKFQDAKAAEIWLAGMWAAREIVLLNA